MSMSRTETLGGKLGQSIRKRIRADLLANEESKESLDGQFARIAIHLQQPVYVWDPEEAEVIWAMWLWLTSSLHAKCDDASRKG